MELRTEYDIDTSNFMTSCFNSMRDFISNTSDYILETDIVTVNANTGTFPSQFAPNYVRPYFSTTYSYFVVHSLLKNVYIIFVYCNDRIGIMVSTEWDSTEEIFYQKDIIYGDWNHAGGTASYFIPMPTIAKCNKLVANYNQNDGTIMFSGLTLMSYRFISHTTTQYITQNLCFGNINKYGGWSGGGFWYGGDSISYFYLNFGHTIGGQRTYTMSYLRWESLHKNKFECFLNINMDNFPNRPPVPLQESYSNYNLRLLPNPSVESGMVFTGGIVPRRNTFALTYTSTTYDYLVPIVTRNQVWATTLNLNYYVPMVISIDNVSHGLPSYWSIFPQTQFEKGHTSNDLNNISIIMRLFFMVQRDPQILNNYSCVGYTDTINFVNMYNMSTNRVINGTFPVPLANYNCFMSGFRRDYRGFSGCCGLAFKMDEQNNE